MGTAAKSTKTSERSLVDKFITWLNGHDMEQEEYVEGLHDIISECNARLEEEKPDETSRD